MSKRYTVKMAEKYKDKIMRVFTDKDNPLVQDDIQRLKLVDSFRYAGTILEFGASDGTVSLYIARHPECKGVLATDIRESAKEDFQSLRKKLIKNKFISKKNANKVTFRVTDSIPSGPFDTACAFEVFEHIDPIMIQFYLASLSHIIKDGGTFFISVPNRFPHQKYEEQGRSRWSAPDHKTNWNYEMLKELLEYYFKSVKFYPIYKGEKIQDGIWLFAKCSQ